MARNPVPDSPRPRPDRNDPEDRRHDRAEGREDDRVDPLDRPGRGDRAEDTRSGWVDGEPERVVPVIDRDPVIDRPLASRPDDITDDITQTTHVDEVEIQITYGDWTLLDTGAIADAVERAADAITSDARLFLEITAGSANPWADPGSGASDDDEDEGGTVGGDGDSDGDEGAGNWGDGGGGARMAGEAETPFQPTIGATWDEVIVAPGADATDGSDGGVDAFAPIEPATIEAPFE